MSGVGHALSLMDAEAAALGALPINLHLPRIARLQQHEHKGGKGGIFGRRAARLGAPVPKPSVIPPAAPGFEFLGGGLAPNLSAPAGAEWRELARSYGMHLLPEGSGAMLLQGSAALQTQLQEKLQPPPELRYGLSSAPMPPQPRQHKSYGHMREDGIVGPDIRASPSLPMLSPGRPGARNWVTFLHGR